VDLTPFTCAYEPESATLVVGGVVDETSSDILREAVREYSRDYTEDLTVDLGAVAYLPSIGIGVLAVAVRRARDNGRTLQLRAVEGSLADRILTLGGLPHARD
jgi:anti-anti-sigma factor